MIRNPQFQTTDLFVSQGRHNYRIPVIVGDKTGHLISFANCRMDTVADGAEEVALVCRRSDRSGKKWSPLEVHFQRTGWDCAMGTATVDSLSEQILISYYLHCHDGSKNWDPSGQGAFQGTSSDGGKTWCHDRLQIKANAMGQVGSSHGSSGGITLKAAKNKGRLLVPARFQTAEGEALKTLQYQHYNCALYSDDRGRTWQTSGPVQPGTGEGCLVELDDGRIYYNSRAYFLDGKRRVAWSYDGGETFTDYDIDSELPEPLNGGCNAGMALFPKELSKGKDIILFSNPAGAKREGMMVRASFGGGPSWPVSKLIYRGPSAYSSMAVSNDGTVYLLYENGVDHPYEKISLARFNLQWLMQA